MKVMTNQSQIKTGTVTVPVIGALIPNREVTHESTKISRNNDMKIDTPNSNLSSIDRKFPIVLLMVLQNDKKMPHAKETKQRKIIKLCFKQRLG